MASTDHPARAVPVAFVPTKLSLGPKSVGGSFMPLRAFRFQKVENAAECGSLFDDPPLPNGLFPAPMSRFVHSVPYGARPWWSMFRSTPLPFEKTVPIA